MIELIVIFATAFLVLPLVDLLADPPRTRLVKAVIIILVLIWIIFLLSGAPVVLFPHTWNANPVR